MGECYTDIEQCHTEYKWTVRQLNLHLDLCERSMKYGVGLVSPKFYTKVGNDMIKWNLQLRFNNPSGELKDWISLAIDCQLGETTQINGRYKIYTLHAKEKKVEVCKDDKLVLHKDGELPWINEFLKKPSSTEESKELFPNDSLTIICELWIIGKPITIPGPRPIHINKCKFFEDYQELFDTRNCSNVTFIVNGEKIEAHKAVLMARSPVFGAMFKHEMMENKENRVEITDMTPEAFTEMLRFIYTNKVRHIDELSDQLLQAADKYEIQILKEMCEDSLFRLMNVRNAAQTLMLADHHNCTQLIVHTINFINKHGFDVLATLGFKTMEKSDPHLVTAMYKALLIDPTVRNNSDQA